MALRPRVVMTVDVRDRAPRSRPLWAYVLASAAPGAAQLAVSAMALPAQVVLAALLRIRPTRSRRTPTLARLLYLRPLAGMADAVGGSVTHANEVIRAVEHADVRVTALTTDVGIVATAARDPEISRQWRLLPVPWLFRGLPASFAFGGDLALTLGAIRARCAPDAVYQRHTRFALAGALAAKILRRPLFLEYNGPPDFFRTGHTPPLVMIRDWCEGSMLTAAAQIVVVSDVARKQLVERGIAEDRIVVNANGVDATRFATGDGTQVRREAGIRSDAILIGFVGSFGPWHGGPILARAFNRVAAEVPNACLLLVGDGDEFRAVRDSLGDLIAKGRVVCTGLVDPSRVPALLDACDILVSPHVPLRNGVEFFGSPTKLFEYMAAGKAIVASRLGQIDGVLEDERSALLVTPGDERALVDALVRAACDGGLRGRLGAAARKDAIDRHSWARNAQRLLAAYAALPAA